MSTTSNYLMEEMTIEAFKNTKVIKEYNRHEGVKLMTPYNSSPWSS